MLPNLRITVSRLDVPVMPRKSDEGSALLTGTSQGLAVQELWEWSQYSAFCLARKAVAGLRPSAGFIHCTVGEKFCYLSPTASSAIEQHGLSFCKTNGHSAGCRAVDIGAAQLKQVQDSAVYRTLYRPISAVADPALDAIAASPGYAAIVDHLRPQGAPSVAGPPA